MDGCPGDSVNRVPDLHRGSGRGSLFDFWSSRKISARALGIRAPFFSPQRKTISKAVYPSGKTRSAACSLMASLLQSDHHGAGGDQKAACQRVPGDALPEKDRAEYDNQNDAELIDRSDAGHRPDFKSVEVA